MTSISTITTCMGRLAHLKLTVPCLYGQPNEQIVVDYSCPEKSGDWVNAAYPNINVIRVPGNQLFNKSKALNIGAAAAKSEWLCFIDADTIVSPDFIKTVTSLLKPRTFIRASSGDCLCGFVICPRDAWQLVKYNEEMEGWGGEDLDFIDGLLVEAKLKEILFNDDGYLGSLSHPEWWRTLFYKEKDRGATQTFNDSKRRWRRR